MSNSIMQSKASVKLKNTLFKLLEEQGITRSQIADKSGVTRSDLSKFLLGRHMITLDKAEMLLDYLGYEFVIVRKKK